jgi:hypothetical protein
VEPLRPDPGEGRLVSLWIAGAAGALIAAAVAVRIEREGVARRNYLGARKLVRTTRRTWLGALWIAVQAVALAAIALGLAYLVSTGKR